MRVQSGWIILGAGLLVAAEPSKSIPSKEETLQGTWAIVSVEINGKKIPERQVQMQRGRLLLKGNKWALQLAGKVERGTFTADSSKDPMELDLIPNTGRSKGKKVRGIYEISDNSLKVLIDNTGKSRPKNFDTDGGKGLLLTEYKRVKPRK